MNITATLPVARELLIRECADRVQKDTLKGLDPKKCTMVLIPGAKSGVIGLNPRQFVFKYWVGKSLGNPNLEVTFVSYSQTLAGTIAQFVEWVNNDTPKKGI